MDDRGYVAQALFDRLSGDGVPFRILGDAQGYPERAPPEVQLAVARAALDGMPRALGQFCRELDLQLVHLAPEDSRAWRCVLAWTDEVGRPRFLSARICSDYCRGLRCYLRAEELLAGNPDTLFSHASIELRGSSFHCAHSQAAASGLSSPRSTASIKAWLNSVSGLPASSSSARR